MLVTKLSPHLLSVRELWEASALDPMRLGCYFTKEGHRYLPGWEEETRVGQTSRSLITIGAEVGVSIKTYKVHDELAERNLRLALANAADLANEPDPEGATAGIATKSDYENCAEFLGLAMAKSALDPLSPPDKAMLVLAAAWCKKWAFQEKEGFDEILRSNLLLGVLAALAGHDLERARKLIEFKKRMPEKQAKLLRVLCKHAELETRHGKSSIRITHPKAVESFFTLFNMYRVPDGQMFFKMWGETPFCISNGAALGRYLLAWLYFQSVEYIDDETVTWPMIAEVMTY